MYNAYKEFDNYNNVNELKFEIIEYCDKKVEEQPLTEDEEKMCNAVRKNIDEKADFFTVFTNIVNNYNRALLYASIFLFVSLPLLYYASNYLKNKQIKNELTRGSYKKTIMSFLKNSYKSLFIFPIAILIVMIISYVYAGSFDCTYSLLNHSTQWADSTLKSPVLFLLLYMINVIIHSILYINISLIVVRKYHNYFVSAILSFLLLIGIEAFLEMFFGGIIVTIFFDIDYAVIFNIINFTVFNDNNGIFSSVIVPFILMLISSFLVYFSYHNKEKLVIDCEKNEEGMHEN